ncbi:MAG: GntR family transcriptional regulator, partial [Lachnospiraceae bacterium]|nr:GntR family transcriptional regulator [Lachnospiraceae bacterium]
MTWNLNSDRPIYAQILDQITTRIICGIYEPGEKLPSVRD